MGTAYNANIVTDGLVLCLDAANPRSYPLSGTSWNDLSGNGNNFTLFGASFDNDLRTMTFNGDGNHARRGVPDVLQIKEDITLSFLHRRAINGGDENGALIRCGVSSDLLYCVFHRSDGSLSYHWFSGSFQTRYAAANCAPLGDWLFTSVRIIGTSLQFYVNGTLVTSTSVTSPSPSSAGTISIGNTSSVGFQDFSGDIAVVLVHNRGLKPEEIRQNHKTIRGRYGI
jgi:hypothetical protein